VTLAAEHCVGVRSVRGGIGRFIRRVGFQLNRGRTLDAVLRAKLPGVRLVNDGGQILATSGRDSISIITPIAGRCLVNVMVDDMLRFANGTGMPPFGLRSLEASMVAGVEFYTPASTPERLNARQLAVQHPGDLVAELR